jgi:hypothetical protein
MPSNRSFFSQFIGSLIGFRPRSPSGSGTSPIKSPASPFSNGTRRRSTSILNGKEGAESTLNSSNAAADKWWIGGRRADGSERYYPIAPLRYVLPAEADSVLYWYGG